jgi:uncharacterized RDD family membrane protein YckC
MKNCAYCGREATDYVTHCGGCGTQFDVSNIPPIIANRNKSPSAGFWIRVLARLIDAVLGLICGLVAGILAGIVIGIMSVAGSIPSGWQHRIHGFSLVSFGFSLLGFTAYHIFCEGIHGATLGKLCCGLRVVSPDGSPSTLMGAVIRSFAYFIDSLFFGFVGYTSMEKSPLNQRYGDVWGGTAVFKVSELASASQRTPARFALGLVSGAICWMCLLAIGLILKVM